MPMICVVSGCANRSNRETDRSFFRVPKVVVHKGEKCRQLTEKRRETWLSNLYLRSGGAESLNARVCSDHFVHGCPSALKDVQSVDWAPTVNLGQRRRKPESSQRPQERMKIRGGERRGCEGAEESPKPQDIGPTVKEPRDAGCQTDLRIRDIDRMEDVLKQNAAQTGDLGTKVLNTNCSQEKSQDKPTFCSGCPGFLVLMPVFQLCEPHSACCPLTLLSKSE